MNVGQWLARERDIEEVLVAQRAWRGCKDEIISLMEERSKKCCGTKAVELDRMVAVIRTVV